jgi:hypothetical protein
MLDLPCLPGCTQCRRRRRVTLSRRRVRFVIDWGFAPTIGASCRAARLRISRVNSSTLPPKGRCMLASAPQSAVIQNENVATPTTIRTDETCHSAPASGSHSRRGGFVCLVRRQQGCIHQELRCAPHSSGLDRTELDLRDGERRLPSPPRMTLPTSKSSHCGDSGIGEMAVTVNVVELPP